VIEALHPINTRTVEIPRNDKIIHFSF